MAKKVQTKIQKKKPVGHKDPVRFPVILDYEGEFHKNFNFISKSIVKDIEKKLKSIQ